MWCDECDRLVNSWLEICFGCTNLLYDSIINNIKKLKLKIDCTYLFIERIVVNVSFRYYGLDTTVDATVIFSKECNIKLTDNDSSKKN